MKKTKLKIFFTNISRVITSILFINIKLPKFINAYEYVVSEPLGPISCYATGPEPTAVEKTLNVFILLAPFALLGLLIAFVIYKIKNKNKKDK